MSVSRIALFSIAFTVGCNGLTAAEDGRAVVDDRTGQWASSDIGVEDNGDDSVTLFADLSGGGGFSQEFTFEITEGAEGMSVWTEPNEGAWGFLRVDVDMTGMFCSDDPEGAFSSCFVDSGVQPGTYSGVVSSESGFGAWALKHEAWGTLFDFGIDEETPVALELDTPIRLTVRESDEYKFTFVAEAGKSYRAELSGTGDADLWVLDVQCNIDYESSNEVCTIPAADGATERFVNVDGYAELSEVTLLVTEN